jgi:hypothetical protein
MRTAGFAAFAVLVSGVAALADTPTRPSADMPVRTEGGWVPSGGSLDFRDPVEDRLPRLKPERPVVRKAAASDLSRVWLAAIPCLSRGGWREFRRVCRLPAWRR